MEDENRVPQQAESAEPTDVSRIEELLNKERYTTTEAAEVLNMRQRTILSAVYGGELKATMAGRDIVSISRTDLVDWIRRREQ
jgi:excisionase family DNA binding protein